MRKIELQFLFCLVLFLGFNFMLKPALGADVQDQNFTYNNYLYRSDSWSVVGQRFLPGHNNISMVSFYYVDEPATVVVCKGVPTGGWGTDRPNVEANAPTCAWSGNTLIKSEVITPTVVGNKADYKFTTPAPIDSVGGDYYVVFIPQGTDNIVSTYLSSGGNSGLLVGGNPGTAQLGTTIYYSDTYTPAPPAPQFQIQLLTPATTTPYTTYYGQPASYTFNYMNPLNWYPQIRFMVKRLADANASAWPDYVNSATFWTSSVATSTLTYGTASFRLPDGQYSLRVDFWANIPQMLGVASTTFTISTGGTYGGYSFSTSTQLFTMPTFNESDVCQNIATSTTFGAIECGLKKALYGVVAWAFVPSFDTLQNFRTSYELWKGCFPFNTYFQLTDTITNAASSTASSTTGTIKIPFIHTNGSFYMLDAISSSTLSHWIGATNYTAFRTGIGYFFWLIAIGIIFFTIKFI